jgi:deoxyribose-phosphate aldolase
MNPYYISYAQEQLQGKGKIGTVVSFPLGQEMLSIKVLSAQAAALSGAHELDVSLNVGCIKEAQWDELLQEMAEIVACAQSINQHIIIKFIPETGYLTPSEIQKVAELMVQAGADFFKTCSGMGPRGATIEDVKLVRAAVGKAIKIKVAGGISTYQEARAFIDAGADRIGTSHAVEIVTEALRL